MHTMKEQIPNVALTYKKLLLNNHNPRPYLGGWQFLLIKNYERTKNEQFLSPEQLGYDIIQPNQYGDKGYERNMIRYVHEGIIEINTMQGLRGSYLVKMKLKNTSNNTINFSFQRGQVFEHDGSIGVSNLICTGRPYPPGDHQVKQEIFFTVQGYEEKEIAVECFCTDQTLSPPSGERFNITPLRNRAAANNINMDQPKLWDSMKGEIHSLRSLLLKLELEKVQRVNEEEIHILKKENKEEKKENKEEEKKKQVQLPNINMKEEIKEKERMLDEYATIHCCPEVNFQNIPIPNHIRNKPIKDQIPLVALTYKKLLFNNHTRRPYLGGWWLLAIKNYKRTKNEQLLSPEQLGYDIIQPNQYGDESYERNMIRYVREGIIEINTMQGLRGSYLVKMKLKNTSNNTINFSFQRGQTFEQQGPIKVQNLICTGRPYPPGDHQVKQEIFFTIGPNEEEEIAVECFCADQDHSSPNGEAPNFTPFCHRATKNNPDFEQENIWESNEDEVNDL